MALYHSREDQKTSKAVTSCVYSHSHNMCTYRCFILFSIECASCDIVVVACCGRLCVTKTIGKTIRQIIKWQIIVIHILYVPILYLQYIFSVLSLLIYKKDIRTISFIHNRNPIFIKKNKQNRGETMLKKRFLSKCCVTHKRKTFFPHRAARHKSFDKSSANVVMTKKRILFWFFDSKT